MDLRARLEASLGDSYTIERELGGGGMSRVFVATEQRLARRVVIKVLNEEMAARVSTRRFAREIRVAASLQQANIVPVLSAGEGDVPYYTMPFVEGLSLRERLDRDGRLPLAECVSILRDVARALAHAHERGVVHRDIKPANILLSGDTAVVTDFGIAKALATARSGEPDGDGGDGTMTAAGTVVGTPAYMAPEQIAGDPGTDHRADLYAFGCLAYELLVGEPPFHGRAAHAIFAAHIGETPVPLGERAPETPPPLARAVMCCLAKDPEDRPRSARELLACLDGVTTPAGAIERFRQRLSWRQRVAAVALVVMAVGAASIQAVRQRGAADPPAVAIAVVPFTNAGGDSVEDYLVDGMSDGLTTALGRVRGIRVVSRTVSNRYRGQPALDARELRRDLGVSHIVHGSWRHVNGSVRVAAQLVSTEDNSEIWSDAFDRSLADVLGVEDDIRRAVLAVLRDRYRAIIMPGADRAGPTADREAYDLYLRGRFLLLRRGVGVRQAVSNFEGAIARDSTFAEAYASLALALQIMPYFEDVAPTAVHERTMAAANRALELDGTLAEAHTALAMAHQHAYEWRAAGASYRRALELAGGEPDVHIQYGRFLFYTGRFGAAMAQFRRAAELDPHSAVASGWVGHMLELAGRSEEALGWIERALQIDSTTPPVLIFASQLYRRLGREAESVAHAEWVLRSVPEWRSVALATLAASDPQPILDHIAELEARSPAILHIRVAMLRLALGDTARALDALERATVAREPWPTYYSLSERAFDVLRRSSRFADILRGVDLDVRTFTAPSGGRP